MVPEQPLVAEDLIASDGDTTGYSQKPRGSVQSPFRADEPGGRKYLQWSAEDGLGRVLLRLKTKRLLMRSLRRRLVQLACFCLSMTVFLASSDQVYGQSGGPSSDQIQMFQNLTPDQQQAILQSL